LKTLAASVKEPSIVLEISDTTDHLNKSTKKDSSYVAKRFIPWCNKWTLTTNYSIAFSSMVWVMSKRQEVF
jgi:hypothetical protein